MRTAEQTEAVLRGLNREWFSGELQLELFVLPPEEGSFLARLGVILGLSATAVWGFAESDIGKAFFKGLTDHEPAYWAEIAGRTVKGTIEHVVVAGTPPVDPVVDRYEAILVCEAAKSFLQKGNFELERVGISPARFRDAFAAKNNFYRACEETRDLRAIGFSEAPVFPIKRDDFPRLQAFLPPEKDEVEHPWHVATAFLEVTSPNWNRTDRARQWKGRENGRDRYFRIDDEAFWLLVTEGMISPHVMDVMKVQWAFQGTSDHPKNCRVLRVLEFNGAELAEALTNAELEVELGRIVDVAEVATAPGEQRDLFDAPPSAFVG